jgi:DNA-binding NarL/FixJ family response regulator
MSNLKFEVLVVDPCRIYCRGFASLLIEAGYATTWIDRVESLVGDASSLEQDILVIGHNLRSCDAFNLGRWALKQRDALRVVLVSMNAGDPLFQSDVVAAGFSACLTHQATEEDVFKTVAGVLTGGLLFPHDIIALAHEPLGLTAAELGVLKLMAEGQNNEAIAASLQVKTNTVKTHVKHIFEKLHVSNREDAIKRACFRELVGNIL